MKQAHGWQLPDHEEHLIGWMSHPKNVKQIESGRVMYQATKQRAAYDLCKSFRTAVDVGGHVGMWSYYLAEKFATVHAFEPVTEHQECFGMNVTAPNVFLHPCALGATAGKVRMLTEQGSSGNTKIDGDGDVEMWTLDSFRLQDVDFMKLDCEGFELYVLQGAAETLKEWKPLVCVEQKPHVIGNFGFNKPEAVEYLQSLGAKVLREISGDYLCGWDRA